MKRLLKRAESESEALQNSSYDFQKLYERTEQHMENIETCMEEILKNVSNIKPDNVILSFEEIESNIDKIYKEALDSYSKVNVSKDLSIDNNEQLVLGKEKIKKIEKELDDVQKELNEMRTEYKNYSGEIEELRTEVDSAKDLLKRMEEHLKSQEKSAINKLNRTITAKRKSVINNVHHEIMESFNSVMHSTHKLEEIKENMKQKASSIAKDFDQFNDEFKSQLEKVFNEIKSNLEDIKDDMEIGLDINSKTSQYLDDENTTIKELYGQLEEVTNHLSKLKSINSELTDEYEALKTELNKIQKLMMA